MSSGGESRTHESVEANVLLGGSDRQRASKFRRDTQRQLTAVSAIRKWSGHRLARMLNLGPDSSRQFADAREPVGLAGPEP